MLTSQRKRKHQESSSADLLSPPTSHRAVATTTTTTTTTRRRRRTRTRWEDLDMDCLTNVFARVGMESLILNVPFVCKIWHEATLNPLCWQVLYFPNFRPNFFLTQYVDEWHFRETPVSERRYGRFYDEFIKAYKIDRGRFTITSFVKLVVGFSKGSALELKMPKFCTEEAWRYVSVACPRIRVLSLPDDLIFLKHSHIIPELIENWKYLEELELGCSLEDITEMVGGNMSILFEDSRVSKEFKEFLALNKLVAFKSIGQLVEEVIKCKHIIKKALEIRNSVFLEPLLPNLKRLKSRRWDMRAKSPRKFHACMTRDFGETSH